MDAELAVGIFLCAFTGVVVIVLFIKFCMSNYWHDCRNGRVWDDCKDCCGLKKRSVSSVPEISVSAESDPELQEPMSS